MTPDQTALQDDVAQVAAVFDRLAQGARLKDLGLPKRVRAVVMAVRKPDKKRVIPYFWL